jgi:DNA repair exonuclease SbcCD ATPase subunit
VRIKALRIQDFKGLRALELNDTDRAIVIVGGSNGAGKSSALDAITVALAGKGAMPAQPIREGQDRAEISIDLGEVSVTRTITRTGGSLKIRTKDGMAPATPQTWLDARVGALACDPVAFLTAKPSEQAAQLARLAGFDMANWNARRQALYDDRRIIGREGERAAAVLSSMPPFVEAPEEEVTPVLMPVSDIIARMAEVRRAGEQVAVQQREAQAARAAHHALEAEHAELRRRLAICEARCKDADAQATMMEREAEAARVALADPAVLEAELAGLEARNAAAMAEAAAVNDKVRANAARRRQEAQVQHYRDEYAARSASLKALEEERSAAIAAAKLPVDGLGLGEDGVTYRGVPLSQASQAERLRIAMGLALADRREIQIVLVRDASLLDDDSMRIIAEMAEAAGAQVWLERVGDHDAGAIIIEDGGVR